MDGGGSHKISCIFGDIDCMETTNADFERSRWVIEIHDIILHLNVVQSGVRSDRN